MEVAKSEICSDEDCTGAEGFQYFLCQWLEGSPVAVGSGLVGAYILSGVLKLTAAALWPLTLLASGIVVFVPFITEHDGTINLSRLSEALTEHFTTFKGYARQWLMNMGSNGTAFPF
ncbi:uncharacterized protein LOC124174237 [Ischnura elegans]|uniref:uncharacterized protein LOC124174237 n=1 Tax=Ischnura elegans TaxID=197161 RepID=UPI001ED874F9|nr:uncharacterized protein LOC124174237 [Ischnura elegans]